MFLQLYRQRTPIDKIYYYQGKGECDFVVQRGIEIESLIQVTWDMTDEETLHREIGGICEAADATGCRNLYIITADTTEEIKLDDGRIIHVLPAWRWLLSL